MPGDKKAENGLLSWSIRTIMGCHGWLSWMIFMDDFHGWLWWMTFMDYFHGLLTVMDDFHGWLDFAVYKPFLHIADGQTDRQTDIGTP